MLVPTLLVHGARDPQSPLAIETKLFSRFGTPDKWWVILPGADHAAHLEKSSVELVRAIASFARRHEVPFHEIQRHRGCRESSRRRPPDPSARASGATAEDARSFNVFEASIPEMQAAMKAGRTTSHEIVQQYLTRIATYEDRLHAAITVNPQALAEADALDRERAQGRVRGPLHGIPIALKDNIHTTDMRTTGGALAFEGLVPPYDATLTRNLRDAGAIIIAKTGMTELANYVAAGMPTNYNAVQGYGFNPYDPRRDPRTRPTDGRCCRPADRARASAPRRTSGPATSAPRRPAPS